MQDSMTPVLASAWMPNAAETVEVAHRVFRTGPQEWLCDTATRRPDTGEIALTRVRIHGDFAAAVQDYRERALDAHPARLGDLLGHA